MRVNYRRVWAMPNKHTFEIPVIRKFIDANLPKSEKICDPFCGRSTISKYRNDMAYGGIDGLEWMKTLQTESMDCVLFDGAYSPRQLKECYNSVGTHLEDTTSGYWAKLRDEIKRVLVPGGIVLSFGWNSVGVGTKRKFEEIDGMIVCYVTDYDEVDGMIVSHGGNHNDTICKAEVKL
jgi:hypothetical protein